MGYSLPLLAQNFCFSSAHYAKIAKLVRSSLRQSQFFGYICWGKQQNFARRSRKQPISLEFVKIMMFGRQHEAGREEKIL